MQSRDDISHLTQSVALLEEGLLRATNQKVEWRTRFYLLRDEAQEVINEIYHLLEVEGAQKTPFNDILDEISILLARVEGLCQPCERE
jgi:hypothetical protein